MDAYDTWVDECVERVKAEQEEASTCRCAPVEMVPGYPEEPCDACMAEYERWMAAGCPGSESYP